MGISRDQKAQNRLAIIAAATRLFRTRGVDGVGLNELMGEAGFTQGGFYNHFESKQALVVEVISEALRAGEVDLARRLGEPLAPGETRVARHAGYYLSQGHLQDIVAGCPVSGFAGDVPRLDDTAQALFADGINGALKLLGQAVAEMTGMDTADQSSIRKRTIGLYCELVGGLILARAVGNVDPDLAGELLSGSQKVLLEGFST